MRNTEIKTVEEFNLSVQNHLDEIKQMNQSPAMQIAIKELKLRQEIERQRLLEDGWNLSRIKENLDHEHQLSDTNLGTLDKMSNIPKELLQKILDEKKKNQKEHKKYENNIVDKLIKDSKALKDHQVLIEVLKIYAFVSGDDHMGENGMYHTYHIKFRETWTGYGNKLNVTFLEDGSICFLEKQINNRTSISTDNRSDVLEANLNAILIKMTSKGIYLPRESPAGDFFGEYLSSGGTKDLNERRYRAIRILHDIQNDVISSGTGDKRSGGTQYIIYLFDTFSHGLFVVPPQNDRSEYTKRTQNIASLQRIYHRMIQPKI